MHVINPSLDDLKVKNTQLKTMTKYMYDIN